MKYSGGDSSFESIVAKGDVGGGGSTRGTSNQVVVAGIGGDISGTNLDEPGQNGVMAHGGAGGKGARGFVKIEW